MLKTFDPATLAAIQTVVTGVGGIFLAALWGIWDRRNRDRKEAKEGTLGERQNLSKDAQTHLDNVERDRDRTRAEIDKLREVYTECFDDRHSVWEALHAFSQAAHDMRHEAIRIIWNLCLKLQVDHKEPQYKVPELDHVHKFYKAQKEKGNNTNDQRS